MSIVKLKEKPILHNVHFLVVFAIKQAKMPFPNK